MNTLLIMKKDVLHAHPEIFKHLVWHTGMAVATAMKVAPPVYITTTHYTDEKTGETKFLEIPMHLCQVVDRDALIKERNDLMKIVDAERAENRKHGIKHLSRNAHKILDKIWNIDEKIMVLT